MMFTRDEINAIVRDEIEQADAKYGVFRSSHEGLGVLIEEMDELREAVRSNSTESIRMEAMQVAGVALRIAYSMSEPDTIRRSGGKS